MQYTSVRHMTTTTMAAGRALSFWLKLKLKYCLVNKQDVPKVFCKGSLLYYMQQQVEQNVLRLVRGRDFKSLLAVQPLAPGRDEKKQIVCDQILVVSLVQLLLIFFPQQTTHPKRKLFLVTLFTYQLFQKDSKTTNTQDKWCPKNVEMVEKCSYRSGTFYCHSKFIWPPLYNSNTYVFL